MVVPELTIVILLAGFVGGVLGAAIGALPALGLAGVVIVIGQTAEILFLDATAAGVLATLGIDGTPVELLGPISAVGVGPVLGPHVAFAGGVGAAAYAGRKGIVDTAFRYHQAKQIGTPLISSPWNLLVGGVFGLLGVLLAWVGSHLPVDPIAFAVVLTALLSRLVFGYPFLGRFRETGAGILDMSPFENGAYWGDEDHPTSSGIAGRHVVEPWQPGYYRWPIVAGLGVGVGIVAGAVALFTDSVFLPFGLALASLLALPIGFYRVPVTHHIALPAAIGTLALGGNPLIAVLCGTVFGLLGAIAAELTQRVCYAHGDTHFDPAFASILLTSLFLVLFAVVGIFESGPIPYL